MVFGFGGSAGLFGGGGGPARTIVPFDTSILANALTPNIRNPATSGAISDEARAIAQRLNTGPQITPPWRQEGREDRTLVSRINAARNLRNFIDLGSDTVRSAGGDPDREATFALFQALEHLQSLALFASERNTPEASLRSLNETFQRGLSQVQDYITNTELDKLNLFFGDRASSVTSQARIGAAASSRYTGASLEIEELDEVIPGLKGDEQFLINLRETVDQETPDQVLIDLAELGVALTPTAVVEFINNKIKEIPELDDNGDPKLDDDEEIIPKYETRFSTTRVGDSFGIRVQSGSAERVSLTGLDPNPSVYLASNFSFLSEEDETAARITRIDDIGASEFTIGSRTDFNSIDIDESELRDAVIEAENERREEEGIRVRFAPPGDLPVKTTAGGIAVDSQGFSYVVGTTAGDLGSQLGDGEDDVFLTKFDSNGNVVFRRLIGSQGESEGFAVTVDNADNVIVAGQTNGSVSQDDVLSGNDAFVVKYTANGDEVFRHQLDAISDSSGLALETTANGDVVLAGITNGSVGGNTTSAGGQDAFLLRLSGTAGDVLDQAQFGTSGTDTAGSLLYDVSTDSIFFGAKEGGDGVVRRLSAGDFSQVNDTINLGDLGSGSINSLAIEGSQLVVGGTTSSNISGGGTAVNTRSGGTDGFVTTFDVTGAATAQNTTYIGSGEDDSITSVHINGGKIFATGTSNGTVGQEDAGGLSETFFTRIDAVTGTQELTRQLGLIESDNASVGSAISFAGEGVLGRLGLRSGELRPEDRNDITSQTTVKDGDYFFIRVNGGRRRRIEINNGDTLRSLAFRLNALSFQEISARPRQGQLQIAAQDDTVIELFAGPDNKNALKGLGLEPGRITATNILFDINREDADPEDTLGGSFALNLGEAFHLRDKQTARYVTTQIESAISNVQRAFRSLTFNPIAYTARTRQNTQGPVPARLTNQIANYQAALQRLTAGSQASTPSLFI